MGFLDRQVDQRIITTQDGRKIYHPFPFCRGYIIPSEAELQKLRKRLKKYLIFYLIFLIPLTFIRLKYLLILLGPCVILGYTWDYFQFRHMDRNDW